MNENATPLPHKAPTPEEITAQKEIDRQRQIVSIKATIAVLTDGIDFIAKQTVSVGESRRLANFLDYCQDMKRDFKVTLKGLEEPEKTKKPELVEA